MRAAAAAATRGSGVESDFTKMVFPGLNRAGFGSGRTYAMWLIHLGTELGSARLRDADSAARAVLLGEVRRRGRVRAVWYSKLGANVIVGVHRVKLKRNHCPCGAATKGTACSMAHGGRAPRSRPNSAIQGSISIGARPRRGSARYQSLWALWNGGFRARTPRAMAPTAHYNHGEQFSHAQREKKGGKGHGVVITPS